jgi:hypothetical protein
MKRITDLSTGPDTITLSELQQLFNQVQLLVELVLAIQGNSQAQQA